MSTPKTRSKPRLRRPTRTIDRFARCLQRECLFVKNGLLLFGADGEDILALHL